METKKLNNGKTVVAHKDGMAKTYANRTTAAKAAEKLVAIAVASGKEIKVIQSPISRVFYIEVN